MTNGKGIAVLTLNPGIDRAVYLGNPLDVGGYNRSVRAVVNQGSKGANQAILLKNLGLDPYYISFTGGSYGKLYESILSEHEIRSSFVETGCGVRLNIKIIEPDGRGTEINEPGGPVTQSELDGIVEKLFEREYDVISLCGSFPHGVENTVYNSIITRAKLTGAKVVLDCSGEALVKGATACPDVIKPNRDELAAFGYGKPETVENTFECCGKIYEKFGCTVIATLDSKGSVSVGRDGIFRIKVKPQVLKGFSGAGDLYLAGFIYARYAEEREFSEALEYGAAASVAKIRLEGTLIPTREQIRDALDVVTVEKI